MQEDLFILASSSSSRLKLLSSINKMPDIIFSPNIIEDRKKIKHKGKLVLEKPITLAKRLAKEKAEAAALNINVILLKNNISHLQKKNIFILGSDSVIYASAKILEKPTNKSEIYKNISSLSGKRHMCYTAFCIIKLNAENLSICNKIIKLVSTRVTFKKLSEQQKNNYVEDVIKLPSGFSCIYQAENIAGRYISSINGSISGLHGLPLCEVMNSLESLGLDLSGYNKA